MLSKQSLVVALHLYITLHSDAFSLRPPSIAVAPTVTRRISNLVLSPIVPAHNVPLSNTRSSAILPGHRSQGTGPLFASSSNIIPYYDELMERLPSKKVLEAVDKSNGDPIVASDLATKAGISLTEARKDLTTLASLTRGDIAVSSDGELLYTFPQNVNSVLSSNSAKYRAVSTFKEKVFPPLAYATKVGFGVVLVVSLVAIFTTIFAIMTSSGSSDDDRRRDDRRGGGMGGMGGMFGGFWGPSPFDFFYYRPYYSRYYTSPGNAGGKQRDPEEMGFLESVFSYVFGDGNPNGDVEERRIALVAEMIRQNGGAVTAEQLAPFCDDAPMPLTAEGKLGEERVYVDESFVLPIVTQLDGEPQVTEEGDIVYTFPELMTSASTRAPVAFVTSEETAQIRRETRILKKAGLEAGAPTSSIKGLLDMNRISTRGALDRADLLDILAEALPDEKSTDDTEDVSDPTLLLERQYKFSLADGGQTILAGVLGVVNLGGALYLGNLLGQYAAYGVRLPSYMGLVQQFFPLLLGYAVLFNAIPLARNFLIQNQNAKINARNQARKSWKAVLEQNAGNVKRKLMAASRFGQRMKQLGAGGKDIVFDTSKEFVEVEKVKERDAMEEFDKMLDGKESSAWE
mmetsp:Transcript_1537/g.2962  ORF Transcript_1537/g.2962 Transcript_1537/m.2962 type:complete len:628 (+) Transcript_1537:104-1987(+)|eukprot:CAMPEP_0201865936 /NCGR_PEP_ID=MMETSP0902-20130614/685_1 /ASSEMBLY_ACC=CAM_ASM_000551 /TAXON_ID=420261 /ORGANISM="Thalassiosira antarctica, Strain CCMP982" /LENGTH=627 /DNA_ID=CAMNT_0048390805 /DNA_START=98 /DNA_END=1981 /DNA_ORIENTATION=-